MTSSSMTPIRHIVITGGGSGIGRAIADCLAGVNTRITLMGRRLDVLTAVASTLPNTQGISCDVTDESSVEAAFTDAVSRFGAVDILINNAGAAPTAAFHKLTSQQWREIMALNLDGVFHCTRQVIENMRDRGWGRIINIASTAALTGYSYVSAYSAAKHGVLGLTRSLALETATKGITVNAVCPGYTDTDIIQSSVKVIMEKTGRSQAEALKEFTKTNPQGRWITPEEVANTVHWLCQPASASITGQAIAVAGGEVM